jgi:hypothetical protein
VLWWCSVKSQWQTEGFRGTMRSSPLISFAITTFFVEGSKLHGPIIGSVTPARSVTRKKVFRKICHQSGNDKSQFSPCEAECNVERNMHTPPHAVPIQRHARYQNIAGPDTCRPKVNTSAKVSKRKYTMLVGIDNQLLPHRTEQANKSEL